MLSNDPMEFLGSLAGGKQPVRPGAVLGDAGLAGLSEVGARYPCTPHLPCDLQDAAGPEQAHGEEFRKGRWLHSIQTEQCAG